jgi:hypothetical protein
MRATPFSALRRSGFRDVVVVRCVDAVPRISQEIYVCLHHLLNRELVLEFLDKPVFAELVCEPFSGVFESCGFRQSCQAG